MAQLQSELQSDLEKESLKLNERITSFDDHFKRLESSFTDCFDQLKNVNIKMGRNHADSIKLIDKHAAKFGLNDP